MAKPTDFEKLLLDSIDDALLSLGEAAQKSIYLHFEQDFNLNRIEIPKRLDKFQLALEKIFGIGSRYIEIMIMKNLHKKISLTIDSEQNRQLEFIKYVDTVRCEYAPESCIKENL
jgi:hypothetical protein